MAEVRRERCPWEATCPFAQVRTLGGALSDGFKAMKSALPEEFLSHIMAAERESLLAVRSLVDGLLRAMEKGKEKGRRAQRIKVE